jgi:translation elongation factor EF-G
MRKPDVKKPFAALAFKIATDPFGRLAFSVLIQDV